eukprot:2495158-Lingulodinium_polyedra.AAC.1
MEPSVGHLAGEQLLSRARTNKRHAIQLRKFLLVLTLPRRVLGSEGLGRLVEAFSIAEWAR